MKDLLEYIILSIVDNPKEVEITQTDSEDLSTFTVKVNPVDIGKIIGKEGKIIKSIRTLLKNKAFQEGKKIQILLQE